MIPPFEISGKTQLIVASRGHFEISRNRILYKRGRIKSNFLQVYPTEGIGEINPFPSFNNVDAFKLLLRLMKDLAELCFFKKEDRDNITLEFLYGNILPFSMEGFDSGFYELKPLPQNFYEEFYRMTMTLEDTITTTISTFDENVFIPFKQQIVSTVHSRANQDSNTVLNNLSRDFPKFFGLHQDLLSILYTQAKQVSDHQQLSFSLFSPILRKIGMRSKFMEFSDIKRRWGRIIIKIRPYIIDTEQIAQTLTPIVKPR
jgi:hypothetical protein